MKMKKVLIIAYHFPPVGGPSVQRTSKFVKYLPCYGWQPVILTVKNPDSDYFDPTLSEDIHPETVVRRTFSLNLWRYCRIAKYGKKSLYESGDKGKGRDSFLTKPFWIIQRVLSKFANNFLFIPDEYNSWLPFALWYGLKLIRKEGIRVIYATGYPWTSFVIARLLSKVTRIPYVIDFRDPWAASPYTTSKERAQLKFRISKMVERLCVGDASRVINVNDNITSITKRCYKKIDKAKFITITHGFDADDFNTWEAKTKKNGKFIMSHIGTFYSNRKPDKLLEAVKLVIENCPDLKEKIEVRFVGITGSLVDDMVRSIGLKDIIKIVPYCSHKESIAEMRNSNLLVLIQASVDGKKAETATGKIYEYIASGRKILALTSGRNEAVRIIRDLNAGTSVDPGNIEAIAEAIKAYYKIWETGKEEKERTFCDLESYSRKHLTGVLARHFNSIVGEGFRK